MSRRQPPAGDPATIRVLQRIADAMADLTGEQLDVEDLDFYDIAASIGADDTLVEVLGLHLLDPILLDEEQLDEGIGALLRATIANGLDSDEDELDPFAPDLPDRASALGLRLAQSFPLVFGPEMPENPLALSEDRLETPVLLRLQRETVQGLRDIARQMGWTLRGTRRDDIVAQLAAAYRDPDQIGRALRRLSPVERDLVALAAWAGILAGGDGVLPVAERLAGLRPAGAVEPETVRTVLVDLFQRGYLVAHPATRGPATYVSAAWYAQLLPCTWLTPTCPAPASAESEPDPIGAFLRVLLVAHAAGAVELHDTLPDHEVPADPVIWPRAKSSWKERASGRNTGDVEPIPVPRPVVSPRAFGPEARAGQPERMVFYAALMLTARLLVDVPRASASGRRPGGVEFQVAVPPEALEAWLDYSASEQAGALITLWQMMSAIAWSESVLFPARRPIAELVRRPSVHQFTVVAWSAVLGAVRARLAMWLRRLPRGANRGGPGEWVDAPVALRRLYDAAPALFVPRCPPEAWGWRDPQGRMLEPGTEAGWQQAAWPLMRAMLEGPMTWLGLVETAVDKGDLAAVRLTAFGAAMLDDAVAEPDTPVDVAWSKDGQVTVPIGSASAGTMRRLSRYGRLSDVHGDRATWSIDADRVVAALEAGRTPHDILVDLTPGPDDGGRGRGDARVAAAARRAVEAIADRWGRVNVYADLALVTFDDALTAREMAVRTSLERRCVYQVDDSCYVVRAEDVEALVGEMRAAGQTPKVVDAAAASAAERR